MLHRLVPAYIVSRIADCVTEIETVRWDRDEDPVVSWKPQVLNDIPGKAIAGDTVLAYGLPKWTVRPDPRGARARVSSKDEQGGWPITSTQPHLTTQSFQDYLAEMNTLDVYDFDDQVTAAQPASGATTQPATGTAGASTSPTSSPILNEEVQQVMGTIGGFWGSFRKQVFHVDPVDRERN